MNTRYIIIILLFSLVGLNCSKVYFGKLDGLLLRANKELYSKSKIHNNKRVNSYFSSVFRARDGILSKFYGKTGIVIIISDEAFIHGYLDVFSTTYVDKQKNIYSTNLITNETKLMNDLDYSTCILDELLERLKNDTINTFERDHIDNKLKLVPFSTVYVTVLDYDNNTILLNTIIPNYCAE